MSETELGIGLTRPSFRIRFGISFGQGYFQWLPGEIESGTSYPATYLNVPCGDEHWLWGWLCFVVFYARATG